VSHLKPLLLLLLFPLLPSPFRNVDAVGIDNGVVVLVIAVVVVVVEVLVMS
jgi:hypothetical protein